MHRIFYGYRIRIFAKKGLSRGALSLARRVAPFTCGKLHISEYSPHAIPGPRHVEARVQACKLFAELYATHQEWLDNNGQRRPGTYSRDVHFFRAWSSIMCPAGTDNEIKRPRFTCRHERTRRSPKPIEECSQQCLCLAMRRSGRTDLH